MRRREHPADQVVVRRLMRSAMAEMRALGAEEMRLSVAVANAGTLHFSEAMGLRPTTHAMFRRL